MSDPLKVFVVEDSAVARELLVHILESDPGMEVVGAASDGEEALRKLPAQKPDVITMDIHMPKMDGFETARRIMETMPAPIVVVTASSRHADVDMTFRTLEAGALAIVEKPAGFGPEYDASARKLLQTIRLMAEVKVVKRWARPGMETPLKQAPLAEVKPREEIKLAAIGASTGGPVALHAILERLPVGFEVPIMIVQHIATGFIRGMAEWLSRGCALPIRIASHGERLLPGHAYLAPDGFQMGLRSQGYINLAKDESENGLCPSVSYLFRSVAEVYGDKAAGVLLTGMGKDGARELGLMKERGAFTIAQDKESSVIFGMPGEAIRIGAAACVLPPAKIADALIKLAGKK